MRFFLFICKVTLLIICLPAQAHEINPAVVDINLAGERNLSVRFNIEPLLADVDLSQNANTDDSPNALAYEQLRALSDSELVQRYQAKASAIWRALGLDGTVSDAQVTIEAQPDLELPRYAFLKADYTPPTPWIWQAPATTGEIILRDNSTRGYTALLAPGQASARLDAPISASEQFMVYVLSGIEHIIPKGLDHILFVMGLFLFSAHWKPLLAQVSVFTAAHTLTLALASLQIVVISASIVEPLIALSIAYVAFENLQKKPRLARRLWLVLAFGLLHGLGFASVLQEFGLDGEFFVLSLVAFNIGVELGQLLVLLPMFILLGTWAHRQSWYRGAIKIPLSVAIGAVGLYWTFERVLG
ncbi:MAG: HupE/UreJ family protein [Litorivicinus sp.]